MTPTWTGRSGSWIHEAGRVPLGTGSREPFCFGVKELDHSEDEGSPGRGPRTSPGALWPEGGSPGGCGALEAR